MDAENRYLLVFSRPYTFEGQTYDSVDLSGLEDLTAADLIRAQKLVSRGGDVEVLPEMSLNYACMLAAQVTKKPVEFFTGLPARDAVRLKNVVTGFLFGAD